MMERVRQEREEGDEQRPLADGAGLAGRIRLRSTGRHSQSARTKVQGLTLLHPLPLRSSAHHPPTHPPVQCGLTVNSCWLTFLFSSTDRSGRAYTEPRAVITTEPRGGGGRQKAESRNAMHRWSGSRGSAGQCSAVERSGADGGEGNSGRVERKQMTGDQSKGSQTDNTRSTADIDQSVIHEKLIGLSSLAAETPTPLRQPSQRSKIFDIL